MTAQIFLPLLAVVATCVAFLLHQLDGWLDRRHTLDPRFERMRRALEVGTATRESARDAREAR